MEGFKVGLMSQQRVIGAIRNVGLSHCCSSCTAFNPRWRMLRDEAPWDWDEEDDYWEELWEDPWEHEVDYYDTDTAHPGA